MEWQRRLFPAWVAGKLNGPEADAGAFASYIDAQIVERLV
jgi:hypothetical protein